MITDMENIKVINVQVYTVQDAAHLLRVHPNTVRRWIGTGSLRATQVGPNGKFRITAEAIAEFLDGREPE